MFQSLKLLEMPTLYLPLYFYYLGTVSGTAEFVCFFYWNIIALQCCVGFCSTTAWISCVQHTSPPSAAPPSLPTLLGHHTAPGWAPVPCSNVPLPVCSACAGVGMSVPLCPFVPPSPSPTVSQVPSLHLGLYSCCANRLIGTIFLDFIYIH